jgi:uncharacterized protein (TIGR03083 family)
MGLDYLEHIRAESRRFVEVMTGAPHGATVPSCPDWDADDLLWHLTGVQHFWAAIVRDRLQDPSHVIELDRPATRAELVALFEHASGSLVHALQEATPDEHVWTWAPDKTVGFILRRQAHEALIHRLDAELTAGEVTPLPADLATDGVAETLGVMFGGCPPWGTFTPDGRVVGVMCTETATTFTVALGRFTGTDPESETSYDDLDISLMVDPASEPAAKVVGTADDLDAWLWHRRDDSTLTFEGDESALADLRHVLSHPIN